MKYECKVIHTAFGGTKEPIASLVVDVPGAEIDHPAAGEAKALEMAYAKTQNLETSWSKDDTSIRILDEGKRLMAEHDGLGLRSTSVGDMIDLTPEGKDSVAKRYTVALMGFEPGEFSERELYEKIV